MWETLEAWDKALFLYLNGDAGPVWDRIMTLISEKLFWLPLYLLFLWLLYRAYGTKGALLALLAAAVSILLTDQSSVQLFKFQFERYRPCKNLVLENVHNPVACGGKFGFVSSHAANFFGIATLIGLALKHVHSRILLWLYLWAALIGYSRVYLGKHYPADVLFGAILGILIGALVHWGYQKLLGYVEKRDRTG